MTGDGITCGSLDELLAAPPRVAEPLGAGPIVLYGAGNKGRDVLRLLREAGHDVVACIDRRGTGTLDGLPVLAPGDPEVARLARGGSTAVVSIFNQLVDPLEIVEVLQGAGFGRVVEMLELRQLLPVPDTFWCGTTADMTPPPAEARWLESRLSDDLSRAVLRETVALRTTWNPRWLRGVVTDDQFFPAGVTIPRAGMRFVDGGAFDGDTLAFLDREGCTLAAVAAFEPDPVNFAALRARVAGLPPCREVSLWPCGLGDRLGQVRFHAGGSAASKISDDGKTVVQVVALDEVLPGFAPTYVKLDIEGAEGAALEGMAATLAAARPVLAVCLYHKPDDLWVLPRLVDRLLPGCRFYLRAHRWNQFELLLYAIP